MTLTFAARGGGTDLTLEQTGFLDQDARDRHEHGWETSLNALDAALEGRPKAKTPAPTLLGDHRSTYVRSARMAFAEKGIACALESHPPQSPEILALNPFGKMPTYRCGELALYETSAIMRHLDETMPGPALMPKDPAERAKSRTMDQRPQLLRLSGDREAITCCNTCSRAAPTASRIGRRSRRRCPRSARCSRRSIERSTGATISSATALTLADILLLPMAEYVKAMPEGKELMASFPDLRRVTDRLAQRPSYVAATQPPAA